MQKNGCSQLATQCPCNCARLAEKEPSARIVVLRGWDGCAGQLLRGPGLPDGQLLGGRAQTLLALWEERGCEHSLEVHPTH